MMFDHAEPVNIVIQTLRFLEKVRNHICTKNMSRWEMHTNLQVRRLLHTPILPSFLYFIGHMKISMDRQPSFARFI
jgi:hypothetical protein